MGAHDEETRQDLPRPVSWKEALLGSRALCRACVPTPNAPWRRGFYVPGPAFSVGPVLPPIAPKRLDSQAFFSNISISLGYFSRLPVILSSLCVCLFYLRYSSNNYFIPGSSMSFPNINLLSAVIALSDDYDHQQSEVRKTSDLPKATQQVWDSAPHPTPPG